MSGQRVLLVGYGPTAASALRSLLAHVEVTTVVSDAPVLGSGAADLARTHHVAVVGPSTPAEIADLAREQRVDAIVISSYNRILRFAGPTPLPAPLMVNVHYAPLPRYRGRAAVNWAILNGDPSTAITIHRVDEGLDSGNILYQEEVPIGPRDTVGALYERLNALQERHLGPAVVAALAGDPGRPQDHTRATYGCARAPDDGAIDWTQPAEQLDRLIRALGPPFPAAFTVFDGKRLLVHRAEPVRDLPAYAGAVPGRVIARSATEGWVEVLTGRGALRLWEAEVEGTGPTPAARLIRSTRATLGLRVGELLRRLEALEARLAEVESGPRSPQERHQLLEGS